MKADDVVVTLPAPRPQAVRAHTGLRPRLGTAGLGQFGLGHFAMGMHALRHTGQKAHTLLSDLSARLHDFKRPMRKPPLSLQAWQAAANAHFARQAANDPRAAFESSSPARPASPSLRSVRPSRAVLRSIRWVDAQGSQPVVRLRLSGRMADVCDELDRLAALES